MFVVCFFIFMLFWFNLAEKKEEKKDPVEDKKKSEDPSFTDFPALFFDFPIENPCSSLPPENNDSNNNGNNNSNDWDDPKLSEWIDLSEKD